LGDACLGLEFTLRAVMMGLLTAMRTTDPDARTGLSAPPFSETNYPPHSRGDPRTDGIRWTKWIDDWIRRAREAAVHLAQHPAAETGHESFETKPGSPGPGRYEALRRVILTDEVSRTLFEEYALHRATERGKEETGWLLLGLRQVDQAVVLAALPAPADRDAGEAHVWIAGPAHLLASRILRQEDRRLTMLGVVHTHPGSLRHPSKGDLKGDRLWVPQLRGEEGVFGIGTADAASEWCDTPTSRNPKPHMQCLGKLRFSWYTLATREKRYKEVPVELVIGPELARPLRTVWPLIETHGDRLERLAQQQKKVKFEISEGEKGPILAAVVGLAGSERNIRVVLEGQEVRYYWESSGEAFEVQLPELPPDQGVYLLLAELAARGQPNGK
jgi:hypothetical protein